MARKRRMQAVKPASMQERDYSEKYGTSVEEAVALALQDLGLREDQVTVKVLEQPTRGFFGIGASPAHVRVEKKSEEQVRAEAKAAVRELEQKKAESSRRSNEGKQESAQKAFPSEAREHYTDNNSRDRDPSSAAASSGMQEEASQGSADGEALDDSYIEARLAKAKEEAGGEDAYAAAAPEEKPRRERRERGRDRDHDRNGRKKRDRKSDKPRKEEAADFDDSVNYALNADVHYATERPEDLEPAEGSPAELFVKELTEKMGLEVSIVCSKNADHVYVDIDGKDCGTIIGKRGSTLDAIQYLTSLVVNKGEEEYIRVVVDAEGYRAKREKTLIELAGRLANKAVRIRRNVRLEPMNPYERKVIHACLQADPRVKTRSEGEEPNRRVIIEPVR